VLELFNSETGWLNLTNAVLGLAVLACILVVGRVMIQEMRAWASARVRNRVAQDDHAFDLNSLGITMADGGEPVNEMARQTRKPSATPDDPQNIIRSDN
jgi:hypothetical protein